jgi:hypothetical protein
VSVGAADLQKGFVAAWNASGLPAAFVALGGEAPTLQDQEASPKQAYPYCVLDQIAAAPVEIRMSGGASSLRHVRPIPIDLNVFAGLIDSDDRTPKELAAHLAEEVMKVFGGHPTTAATATVELDNGNCLQLKYLDDFGVRIGDDEYKWTIRYEALVDVPAAV